MLSLVLQPTFGYEGGSTRLLFSRSANPHHGFAAHHTYLEQVWKADAVPKCSTASAPQIRSR